MRRPSKPLPSGIKGLTHDVRMGKYFITENGITYSMTLEMTRHLKNYYRSFMPDGNQKFPTLANWYKDLGAIQRKEIVVTGIAENETIDFYPDQYPED